MREGLGDWPFLEGLGLGAPATTHGALYAIPTPQGWYPALIPTQMRYGTIVHGTIHDASAVDMAAVDAFEGEDYLRQAIPVDGWSGYGDTEAQAYIWQGDLPDGAEPIPQGDFVEWLEVTGNAPYAGE